MTFSRPRAEQVKLPHEYDFVKDVYTRMAIYFDLHIYDDPNERDDNKLYQYLYLIIYMLACKAKYFHNFEDYDDFSLIFANKVYIRYVSPKHQGEEDKLKSVLNYCKSLLYPTKVDYQKETFSEIVEDHKGRPTEYGERVKEAVQQDYCNNEALLEMIIKTFENSPKYIKKVISYTPYRNDKLMVRRLYMSVLLSLLKSVTFSNANINKLKRREDKNLNNDEIIISIYKKEQEDCVTLWRLDDKYYNLVHVLTKKVRRMCAEEISSMRKDFELSDEDINSVIMSAYGNVLRDDNEEQ